MNANDPDLEFFENPRPGPAFGANPMDPTMMNRIQKLRNAYDQQHNKIDDLLKNTALANLKVETLVNMIHELEQKKNEFKDELHQAKIDQTFLQQKLDVVNWEKQDLLNDIKTNPRLRA